jgi:HSP20 family protein
MPLPSVLDEIDRLFDELVHRPWRGAGRQIVPAEMQEVDDGWIIRLPVPGMRASDLKVQVHGRQLTITGERQQQKARAGKTGWTRTQQAVTFKRTLTLPADVDPDNIEARIEDSTLNLHIRRRS